MRVRYAATPAGPAGSDGPAAEGACPVQHASSAVVVLALLGLGAAARGADDPTERVGTSADGRTVTPVNQVLTPVGRQVPLPGLRPQAIALSPDGRLLVTAGKTNEIVVVDPATGEIVARVKPPADDVAKPPADAESARNLAPDTKAIESFTGLVFAPDGMRLYMSNVHGSIKVFAVADGAVTPSHSIRLPTADAPARKAEIPAGLAVSDDGGTLYVCGNLSNRLLEVDTATGEVRRTFDVGVAPYDVVLVGDRAFVSNWGGRRPASGDVTGPAGKGTLVRVDPTTHVASEGSVSIVDLRENTVRETLTGRHASALAVSPDRRHVVCANAADDTLAILDAATGDLVETVWTKRTPADLFGAAPNALAFDPAGTRLYVCNGSQNAVAVLAWDPAEKGDTRLVGLVPVGWYPGAIAFDASRGQLAVANIKGLPTEPKRHGKGTGFNSHQYHGSLSLVPVPDDAALAAQSEVAAHNMRAAAIRDAFLPPRDGVAARAIPERIGEPSLIEHVVYVIKENRTYDQVLGDLPQGNGHADLCIFGAEITPNHHAIATEFVLLDNAYCCGILSADGHNWSTSAVATDYLEKSFAGFPRSYPDGMGPGEIDALAYSPAGFIWDSARVHGRTIRNYGEFMMPSVRWKDPARKGAPDYLACYAAWKAGPDQGDVIFGCEPAIESVRPFSPRDTVGWDMRVPDQLRADVVLRELAGYEREGRYPNLVIICLPNDHTSGTSRGSPTPASCMADNDLAFGRIVEGLSKSPFWPRMAIFAIEDDPQAGWDHVSGYRTTCYVASPYARRGVTVSTQYNTTSILRTIGQILGLRPMNQFDASATPMFDCFTDEADLRPFVARPATVPLDQMNPAPQAILDPVLRAAAIASAAMNFREIDRAPEDALNRVLWAAMKGPHAPYPQWAVGEHEDDDEDETGDARDSLPAAEGAPPDTR
ncbi:MAG TPA: phosphoesterase [Planctomycetaceae bacterium]|nr:phosphoesterase [Planctomycetaceae bacterium]